MTLRSHVVINGVTQIGENSTIHPFVSLGATPQDLKYRGEPSALVVGRDCAVHEFSSVSGGTAGGGGATTLGDGVLLMSHTHVGHDCTLGDRVVLASGAALAGHVRVGDGAQVSGHSGVHQKVSIGAGAFVAAASTVVDDLIPYGLAVGNRATLRGLNLVGLRRAGAPRDEQRALLRGFRYLFGLRPSGLAPPLPLPPLAEIKARAALLRDHDAAAAAPRLAEVCEFVLGDRGPGHAFERALCWPRALPAPFITHPKREQIGEGRGFFRGRFSAAARYFTPQF